MTNTYETRLIGLATAVPTYTARQEDVARLAARAVVAHAAPSERDAVARRTRTLFARSGVRSRQSVLPDFSPDAEAHVLFPSTPDLEPAPTTHARMAVYARESVPLAARAARRALDDAGLEARAITHVVLTTCTGFFAPGPDVALVDALGLPATVSRTIIGFMGCYAGFTAIRLAHDLVTADPDAVVLTISVELCSLHFQRSPDAGSLVAMALFGDGAAAAVFASSKRASRGHAGVRGTASALAPDTRDAMTWTIGDHGFEMQLSPAVPRSLRSQAPRFFDVLASRTRLTRAATTRFCIHPGGPRIIEAIRDVLAVDRGDVETSLDVLRDHGNLSSAAIFFVLERELRRGGGARDLVLLGFGPGLAMEGAVLRVGAA